MNIPITRVDLTPIIEIIKPTMVDMDGSQRQGIGKIIAGICYEISSTNGAIIYVMGSINADTFYDISDEPIELSPGQAMLLPLLAANLVPKYIAIAAKLPEKNDPNLPRSRLTISGHAR